MLTWNKVLKRIKDEICLPNHILEKTDKDIIEYLTENCLPKLDDFYPDRALYGFNALDSQVKVADEPGVFYIFDADNREIYGIVELIVGYGSDILFGRIPMQPLSWETIPYHELGNFMADNAKPFTQYNFNVEFLHPNKFRITPLYEDKGMLIYERTHAKDLTTVPKIYENIFIELALGMFMKNIGRLRTRYANIQTAFGEIQLNGEDLRSEGTDIYNAAWEDLRRSELTNILVDRG